MQISVSFSFGRLRMSLKRRIVFSVSFEGQMAMEIEMREAGRMDGMKRNKVDADVEGRQEGMWSGGKCNGKKQREEKLVYDKR